VCICRVRRVSRDSRVSRAGRVSRSSRIRRVGSAGRESRADRVIKVGRVSRVSRVSKVNRTNREKELGEKIGFAPAHVLLVGSAQCKEIATAHLGGEGGRNTTRRRLSALCSLLSLLAFLSSPYVA
jgi:hypothetical protein